MTATRHANRRITITTIALAAFVLTAAGCRTAEPLPEVMSDAEFDARMAEIEQWRDEQLSLCDDPDCRLAVIRESHDRMELILRERIDRVEARWDAQRRR